MCGPFPREVTLRILTLVAGAGCFLFGATIAFAIVRAVEMGSPELAFVVGAILGTQVAAVVHHRQSGSTNSFLIKVALGATLAVTAVAMGIVLHFGFSAFNYPEISVPMGAIGSFVFPFVLFDTMWKALSKAKVG
jgi:hypothetical protein